MRDPHVRELRYKIVPSELTEFVNPSPANWEWPECRVTAANGIATIALLEHYPTVDEARRVVERYLRGWEISSGLQSQSKRQPFHFEFRDHVLIDRNPDPEQELRITMQARASVTVSGVVSDTYRAYPVPLSEFDASPDVQAMWWRWKEYKAGRESLPSMAYFCLTVLEASMGEPRQGQRRRAAARYAVAIDVLNTLGHLVSEVGGQSERRKEHAKEKRAYSADERRWVEIVTLALIRRVGAVAHLAKPTTGQGVQLPAITMADFPSV